MNSKPALKSQTFVFSSVTQGMTKKLKCQLNDTKK